MRCKHERAAAASHAYSAPRASLWPSPSWLQTLSAAQRGAAQRSQRDGTSSGRPRLLLSRHRPLASSKLVYRRQSVQLRGVLQLAQYGSAQGRHTPSTSVKHGDPSGMEEHMQPMHLPSLSRVQSVMELSLHRCGAREICRGGLQPVGSAAEAAEGQGSQEAGACPTTVVQWAGSTADSSPSAWCLNSEHSCLQQCCHTFLPTSCRAHLYLQAPPSSTELASHSVHLMGLPSQREHCRSSWLRE